MATTAGDSAVTIRISKVMRNAVLGRRQMLIDVIHPGRANVPKAELREKLGKQLKVKDPQTVIVFGLRSEFGGVRTKGFANVYDSVEGCKKVEAKHRQIKAGILEKKEKKGRKGIKEAKNRGKKIFGTVKKHAARKAKRQKQD